MNVNPINTTNFKAIPIAKANVYDIKGEYKLYQLSQRDISTLQKTVNNLNLQKLAPQVPERYYETWKSIIYKGIATVGDFGRQGILCTYNNKPCGVLNYTYSVTKPVHTNYVATWPVEPEKKVPLANKVLFYTLFNKIANKNKGADLYALTDSAYDPVLKYLHLGFNIDRPYDQLENAEHMSIDSEGINSSLRDLAERIELTPLENEPSVDLSKELNLVV